MSEDDTKIGLARAALQSTLGVKYNRTFDTGKISIVETADLKAKYVTLYSQESYDKTTKKGSLPLRGFLGSDGVGYIDKTLGDTKTVIHEMLHQNQAGDFPNVMGKMITEGMTEKLALETAQAAGIKPEAESYAGERKFVELLLAKVGDGLVRAYFFGGAGGVMKKYPNWDAVRPKLISGDPAQLKDAIAMLKA